MTESWNSTGTLTIPKETGRFSIGGEHFIRMEKYHELEATNKKLLEALLIISESSVDRKVIRIALKALSEVVAA